MPICIYVAPMMPAPRRDTLYDAEMSVTMPRRYAVRYDATPIRLLRMRRW